MSLEVSLLLHLPTANVNHLTQLSKKYFIRVISCPDILFCCNLKSKPSCQTIKCFRYIREETPLCAIDSKESPALKPDCFGDIKLFLETCYYKVTIQTLYCNPGEEKLDNNFLCTVFHRFICRNNICLFPFGWKLAQT